jgi:hypothetical protein
MEVVSSGGWMLFCVFPTIRPENWIEAIGASYVGQKKLGLATLDVTFRHKRILQIRSAGMDMQILWLLCRFTNSGDSIAIETFARSRLQVNHIILPEYDCTASGILHLSGIWTEQSPSKPKRGRFSLNGSVVAIRINVPQEPTSLYHRT